MSRVFINLCPIEELMTLPGVGANVADKILDIREANGNLQFEDLRHVSYLKLTPQLVRCLDFSPLQEGEWLGERRGSLDDRHKERVRSVDQFVEEWEGAGPGHPQGFGKNWGQQTRGPPKAEKPYQFKQEEEWWHRSQSPVRFEDDYGELDSAVMEKQAPEGEDRGYFEGSGGNPGESAPGQSKSPSVRRTRRDDFELDSSREERDREYVHDSQNRTAGLECSLGYYGYNCNEPCDGYLSDTCDRECGVCRDTSGCKPVWQPGQEKCDLACVSRKFGDKCTQTYHCINKPCDSLAGTCPPGGCQRGYKGFTCSTECSTGTYGVNCESCCDTCINRICDRFDGNYTYGCIGGFKGDRCNFTATSQSATSYNAVYTGVGSRVVTALTIVIIVLATLRYSL